MPKIYLPPAFIVVVDTNAIFSKDTTALVNSEFSKCWEECSKITKLKLIVPEVVREERIYQLHTIVTQNLKDASRTLDKICKVSRCEKPAMPTLEAVKKGIQRQFDAWIKKHSGAIQSVPHETIDWKRVINDAIWRNFPFSPPVEDKKCEKGFRDCLILETLNAVIQCANNKHVSFVTADKLMQQAAKSRFDSDKFSTYDNLHAFASYLNLLKQKESEELVGAIMEKAPNVFYDENNPECLYFKLNVFDGIIKEWSASLDVYIEVPQSPSNTSMAASFLPNPPGISGFGVAAYGGLVMYLSASDEQVYVDSTKLEATTKSAIQWKTMLRFVRLFKKPPAYMPPIIPSFNEIIRTREFTVIWQAEIDAKLNFHDSKLIRIELGPESTEPAFLNKGKYGFPDDQTLPPN
jgi:hypothetical protein